MKWSDDYWPLLLKVYKKKPEGVKPLYSRAMVELALELHITPQELHRRMLELRNPSTPFVSKLMNDYSSPSFLNKAVKTVRQKEGLGTAGRFYDGIEMQESWEKDFRQLSEEPRLMPVSLILILDLYFQLTPTTMVADTEEVQQLARTIRVPVSLLLRIMELFMFCDPYMKGDDFVVDDLLFACSEIWNRFGYDNERLSQLASQMKEYFN